MKWIFGLLAAAFIASGAVFFYVRYSTPVSPVSPSAPATVTPTATAVPQESTTLSLPEGTANYQSENFKVGEVAIGGEAEIVVGETVVEPVTISDIRAEAFGEKNKDAAQLVITWTTNRLAQSEIGYAKGVGQTPKTISESDYSVSHALIVPGLEPASTYVYTITSTDRFGNATVSEPHAVSTGSRSVSLFELIAQALGNIFGWAVKK